MKHSMYSRVGLGRMKPDHKKSNNHKFYDKAPINHQACLKNKVKENRNNQK